MRHKDLNPFWLWTGLMALALTMLILPAQFGQDLRTRVLSSLSPILIQVTSFKKDLNSVSLLRNVFSSNQTAASSAAHPELRELETRNQELSMKVLQLKDSKLKLLAQLKAPPPQASESMSGIPAQVIIKAQKWQEPVLGLDRGGSDGVKQHAGVLFRGAVLGRIISSGPRLSQMAFLTNTRVRISGRLLNSRETGIVKGVQNASGENYCSMRIIAPELKCEVGEHVVTSGYDGSFPSGCLIGKVVAIQKVGEMNWELVIRPACNQTRVEAVYILTGKVGE